MRVPDVANNSFAMDTIEGTLDPVIIAVVGLTGVGKSTLISLLGCRHVRTQESSVIGSTLNSETKVPDYFVCERRGRKIYLIDTPGFDDSLMSNSKVLRMIAQDLAQLFKNGKFVDGVVYLHKITDNRMGGHAEENVELFEKLCGEEAMTRVILLTTMWDAENPGVPGFTFADFERKEEQLISEHWSKMVRAGATPLRSSNNPESAMRVVDCILDNKVKAEAEHPSGKGLRIQKELVIRKMPLPSTGAGSMIAEEFQEMLTAMREEKGHMQWRLTHDLPAKDRSQVDRAIKKLSKRIQDYEKEQESYFNWNWIGKVADVVFGLLAAVGIGVVAIGVVAIGAGATGAEAIGAEAIRAVVG